MAYKRRIDSVQTKTDTLFCIKSGVLKLIIPLNF